MLFFLIDLAATFVFAISGATQAVRHRLDLFGVLVVAWAASVSGGIARDILLGAVPPVAIVDWRYIGSAVVAGLLAFYASEQIDRMNRPVQLFDAAGLCLFAVTGTHKAMEVGIEPAMAAIVGMITAISGGVARDLLTMQIPSVLRSELYAVAALGGAGSVALGSWLALPKPIVFVFGAAICLFLRLGSIYRGWHLPVAGGARQSSGETDEN
jgi:uncharacterized membrane protein YeiH